MKETMTPSLWSYSRAATRGASAPVGLSFLVVVRFDVLVGVRMHLFLVVPLVVRHDTILASFLARHVFFLVPLVKSCAFRVYM